MDTLAVELIIDDQKATVKLDNFGQKIKLVSDDINQIGGDTKFAGKLVTDLDALSKRSEATYKSFQDIARTRLDAGNVGILTKEIVRASERSRQLSNDITQIRRELANPNRKSSIAFLTEELRAAEREAEGLNRKLDLVNVRSSSNSAGGRTGGGRRRGISQGQAAFLEVIDDFAPVGLNRPFNAVAREALQNESLGLAKLGATSIATFGAVAAIGAVIVTQSKEIRDQAERRLKAEELIAGTINKQIISSREVFQNFEKAEKERARAFQFNQDLQKADKISLERERDSLTAINKNLLGTTINAKGEAVENEQLKTNLARLAEINNRLRFLPGELNEKANVAFSDRNESFKRSQQNALLFEKTLFEQREALAEKRKKDFEQATEKIKQLEKQYLATFDALNSRINSDNPFVQLFTEGDKALRELKENIKGLPQDLQAVALKIQQQFNLKKLLETGVDNRLSVFDLRESANNFRNPFDGDQQKKDQDEFIERFLRNNPNYLFLQNKKSLDDDERQKILKRFAPSGLNETPADRLNKNLDDKFNLLYKPGQTAEQLAIADKRFISATNGVNALDLNKTERERAAVAREREALRQERYLQEGIALSRQQLATQNRIAENTKRQNDIAGTGGTKALELTLKNASDATAQLQPAATSADTNRAYFDPDLPSLNSRGTLTNR